MKNTHSRKLLMATSTLMALVAVFAFHRAMQVQAHFMMEPTSLISVNSTADNLTAGDSNCTLREAIMNANSDTDTTLGDCTAGNGADAITLPAGMITLQIAGAGEDDNATGDLDVTDIDGLTINGTDNALTILDANGLDRAIENRSVTGLLVLNNLTVQNGNASAEGGGISSLGNLSLTDVNVLNNTATDNGGGVFANIGATINGGLFQNNTSVQGAGGGLYTRSSLTLVGTHFLTNTASFGGGASISSTISFSGTLFSGNTATSGGGGLEVLGTGTIQNSTFDSNLVDNLAGFGTGGGLQLGADAVVTIIDSSFTGNQANGNNDDGGGAIMVYGGTLTVTHSSLIGNGTTSHGGAVSLVVDSEVTILNTTIHNTTGDGALYNNGTLIINNSTVNLSNGGALINNGTASLYNTILANSVGVIIGADCVNTGTLAANDHNLIEDGSCSPAVSGDPLLDTPGLNGGLTINLPLLPGSPAINAGNNATCLSTDQRGVTRPQGSACDIGAFEVEDHMIYLPLVIK